MDIGTAKLPPRRAPRHPAPSARRAGRDRDGHRRVLPARRPGRHRADPGPRTAPRSWSAGPGLYIQSVVDEIDFPATDPEVRARLEGDLGGWASTHLFGLLDELDPAAAASIGPANGRKIVRALEVIELTGRPFTATMPPPRRPRYGAVLLRLDRPTDQLDQRLSGPGATAMVDAGFPGRGPARWTRRACAGASPPPGPSATRSCWPCWTATTTSSRPSPPRPRPPGGSSAGNAPGSAATIG